MWTHPVFLHITFWQWHSVGRGHDRWVTLLECSRNGCIATKTGHNTDFIETFFEKHYLEFGTMWGKLFCFITYARLQSLGKTAPMGILVFTSVPEGLWSEQGKPGMSLCPQKRLFIMKEAQANTTRGKAMIIGKASRVQAFWHSVYFSKVPLKCVHYTLGHLVLNKCVSVNYSRNFFKHPSCHTNRNKPDLFLHLWDLQAPVVPHIVTSRLLKGRVLIPRPVMTSGHLETIWGCSPALGRFSLGMQPSAHPHREASRAACKATVWYARTERGTCLCLPRQALLCVFSLLKTSTCSSGDNLRGRSQPEWDRDRGRARCCPSALLWPQLHVLKKCWRFSWSIWLVFWEMF